MIANPAFSVSELNNPAFAQPKPITQERKVNSSYSGVPENVSSNMLRKLSDITHTHTRSEEDSERPLSPGSGGGTSTHVRAPQSKSQRSAMRLEAPPPGVPPMVGTPPTSGPLLTAGPPPPPPSSALPSIPEKKYGA